MPRHQIGTERIAAHEEFRILTEADGRQLAPLRRMCRPDAIGPAGTPAAVRTVATDLISVS